ncbi:MAG: hypothetical protein ACPLRW_07995 [Moorellales bacterium]
MERERLVDRRHQWERFNVWEAAAGRHSAAPKTAGELIHALRWFAEAWELAREANPNWAQAKVDADKIRRLQDVRRRLARLSVGGWYDRSRA